MRSLLVGAVLALGVGVGTAQADNWKIIDANSTSIAGVDEDSIRTAGTRKTSWVIIVNAAADANGGIYSLMRVSLDCQAETFRILSVHRYARDGGQPVSREADQSGRDNDIVPGTTGDRIREAVCEGVWLRDLGRIEEVDTFVEIATRTLSSDRP